VNELRYPIGKFQWPGSVSAEERAGMIDKIADTPARLREAVQGLTPEQLDTPYREGGWTVRQVVHHVPDSHLNSYIRFKLALTEDEPTIKPYDEAAWALLSDTMNTPVEVSLGMLDSLHVRWVVLMQGMSEADWARTFRHPELGPVRLDRNLALYVWHGEHHVQHISALRRRNGW
jgi:uncharacterized damage-inducible protein DinB